MRLKLREVLEERQVKPAQLADRLGVSRSSVNAWLHGRKRGAEHVEVYPDFDRLEAICLALECTPNDLLELDRAEAVRRLAESDHEGELRLEFIADLDEAKAAARRGESISAEEAKRRLLG